ncbi:MAG: transposase, partial [Limnospira maxima]
ARSLSSIPENMDDIPELNQAFEIANQAGLTLEELEELERREMFIYDQQGAIALGLQQGRQQGREEGREEAKRETARNLLGQLNDETIAQATGLSLEEIATLREERSSD